MSNGFDELIENHLSRLEPEYIDSFREIAFKSIDDEFKKIESRYESHEQREYDDPELEFINGLFINDDALCIGEVSALIDELSIVALYKNFEIKHKKLIMFHRKDNESHTRKYSYWDNVLAVLPDSAKQLSSFRSIDELRLINNSVKHEGVVSKELANSFPEYGAEGDELIGLDKVFDRLKPEAIKYISELHQIYKSNNT